MPTEAKRHWVPSPHDPRNLVGGSLDKIPTEDGDWDYYNVFVGQELYATYRTDWREWQVLELYD